MVTGVESIDKIVYEQQQDTVNQLIVWSAEVLR